VISMKHKFQISESIRLGAILALSGGFMDAYSYMERGEVFAKSDGSGGDWFGAACCRIRLWKDDFIGGGFGDFNNRTAWRTGDGFDV
jgi:hypothetical protein